MIVYDYYGQPLTTQRIVPGNTVTSLSKYCYNYFQYRLNFIDADVELTVNSWIAGASSGAHAKIVSVHNDATTPDWNNDTGYLILDSWNGTAFTDTEEIKQGAQATAANVSGLITEWSGDYLHKGMQAKAALVISYANTAFFGIDGGIPDQSQQIGMPLVANSSILLKDINAIKNFKVLDYTSGSYSIVYVTFFF